jgi:hypothetical protein
MTASDAIAEKFMVSIPSSAIDDPRFVAMVGRVVSASVRALCPADVFVTQIDHWFDHKWLGFSGKFVGAVGVHNLKRLTVPPFAPRRVISQDAYRLEATTGVYRPASVQALHHSQPSGDNLTRYLDRVSSSAVFCWFSGGTAVSELGCLMMYECQQDSQRSWYASFRRENDWIVHRVRGLSASELNHLLASGTREQTFQPRTGR